MGVLAGLGGAFAWALSSTLLASQTAKIDSLTAAAIRVFSAAIFLIAALFILNAQGDIGRMDTWDFVQLAATGVLNLLVGETLYAASVSSLGLTRSFTTVMGTYNLAAFGFGALLLGEAVTVRVGVGAGFILTGVYLVATYGRARHDRQERAEAPGEVRLPVLGTVSGSVGVGILIAMLAGAAWGTGAVWLRHAADGFDAPAVSAVRIPPAMLLLVTIAVAQSSTSLSQNVRGFSRRLFLVVGVSGILSQGVSGLMFVVALAEVGAGQTVVLLSTAPLWGLVLGAIVLREPITRWVVVGSALALGGIALLAL